MICKSVNEDRKNYSNNLGIRKLPRVTNRLHFFDKVTLGGL